MSKLALLLNRLNDSIFNESNSDLKGGDSLVVRHSLLRKVRLAGSASMKEKAGTPGKKRETYKETFIRQSQQAEACGHEKAKNLYHSTT